MTFAERTVNGQPGLIAQRDGITAAVYAFEIAGDRIKHIWAVLNPGKLRGTVILGCTLSTGPLDLGAVLAGLRDRHPGIVVQLRQSLTGSAGNLRAVLDGSMDIALTAGVADPGTGRPRGVILSPLASEALVFVCPADHPLSGRASVTVADLAGETILRFPPGWGVRDTVDRVLGPDPAAIEIADYALMLKLIQGRFGTTLMPAAAVLRALSQSAPAT